jgi:hypothetical protein
MNVADEALRIHLRWVDEIVEQFSTCPFAAGARRGDHVGRRIVTARDAAAAEETARAAIETFAGDGNVHVALIIFPSLAMSAPAFDRFCQPLRQAHRAFVGAVFHPETSYSLESPSQAVGFFRRAPDPTLQLLRADELAAIRDAAPGGKFLFDGSAASWAELQRRGEKQPMTDRIADDNFALATGGQLGRMQAILDDIAADRQKSYAACDDREGAEDD